MGERYLSLKEMKNLKPESLYIEEPNLEPMWRDHLLWMLDNHPQRCLNLYRNDPGRAEEATAEGGPEGEPVSSDTGRGKQPSERPDKGTGVREDSGPERQSERSSGPDKRPSETEDIELERQPEFKRQ